MKVSLNWLSQYVDLTLTPEQIADGLTMAGLEVEGLADRYAHLDTVIVGRVADVRPHPDADKLTVCTVETGEGKAQVVCGAPNAAPGILAPLALPGTVLPNGMEIRASAIRGVTSEGMLCSETELELGTDASGLMILKETCRPGDGLKAALSLSDTVFEVSITPNRPDCLSMIGVAREIAALQKSELRYPDITLTESGGDVNALASVIIQDPDHCPRYAARVLTNVTVGPSPFWLQDRLLAIGQKPVNNIVDITNFVMMELGQPLHAFDLDMLEEQRIVVRTASEGEPFTTLDDKARTLSGDMLMICDGKKPVAVGGVMGGLNSEITEKTARVLLESACFNPASIRKTAKTLGLSTEASYRFERGVDPMGTVRAADRACQLMIAAAGAELAAGVIDAHPRPASPKTVSLSVRETARFLSMDLDAAEVESLLTSIEFAAVRKDDDRLEVTVPTFRPDVERPVDLMEEVARLKGYDNIPVTSPSLPVEAEPLARSVTSRRRMKTLMNGAGFSEIITYSFNSASCPERLRIPEGDPRRRLLSVLNPLTEDQTVMRTSLIPGLLETMRLNISQQNRHLRLFEIGKIFISNGQDALPDEIEMLAALWTGARQPASWHGKETACDYFDMKGAAEYLLEGLDLKGAAFTAAPDDACYYTKPGASARIMAGDVGIGRLGAVHPEVLKNFGLKQAAFILEFDLDVLGPLLGETPQYVPIVKYPPTDRDITLIVDRNLEAQQISDKIRSLRESLVEDAQLTDAYEGAPIPAGKKSLTFRITYRAADRTLEDEAVNAIHKSLSETLKDAFDATFPG